MSSPFVLAASAELLFVDLPVAQRVQRIHDLGFAVEIWDWTRHDLDELTSLHEHGVEFASMTGYVRGDLISREGADELLRTAEESIAVAQRLGARAMNLHGTGLGPDGLPLRPVESVSRPMWLAAKTTLSRIADLGEHEGVTFVLENLNRRLDHPGTPFASAHDTLALVSSVNSRHLLMNLDLYHEQIDHGNLIETCRAALPWIGEVQVADVPGRCEPGTGEINYANVARALADAGYVGVVGLEARASGDPVVALQRFRESFTIVPVIDGAFRP